MLAARLRRSVSMNNVMQKLRLLTLGQTISHLAILPYAKNFINDLAAISYYPPLAWDDSSKDDWISRRDQSTRFGESKNLMIITQPLRSFP